MHTEDINNRQPHFGILCRAYLRVAGGATETHSYTAITVGLKIILNRAYVCDAGNGNYYHIKYKMVVFVWQMARVFNEDLLRILLNNLGIDGGLNQA